MARKSSMGALAAFTALALAPAPGAGQERPCDTVAGDHPTTMAAFRPEDDPEAAIVALIDVARSTVRLAAFALSSEPVVDSLLRARRRGVDVGVVVDHRHNVAEDPKGAGRRALQRLVDGGAAARTHAGYRIHHDKSVVVDARHVLTGSYNFSPSARLNSENVLVVCHDARLASRYLAHWQSNFNQGQPYVPARGPGLAPAPGPASPKGGPS